MSRPKTTFIFIAAAMLLCRCDATPTLGASIRNVEIKAMTAPGRAVTVTATTDGKLVRLLPSEGAVINAGDTLAVLSNPSLDRDFELAHAQVALAEANLRQSAAPRVAMASNLSAPRIQTALELVLENKRAKLQRYRELRRHNDVAEQELEDAENEYAWAQRDYLTQRDGGEGVRVDDRNRAALQIELVKAHADERAARERLDALRITSPISGTVTATHAIQGQAVYTRDPLLDVTDLSTIEVRGDIAPELLQFVQPGTPVDVKIFSVPPRTFRVAVDHVVAALPNSSASSVVVRLPNGDGQIKPNTPAKITARF